MCDEDHIAATLRRNHSEAFTSNLKRDIEAFFAQKYGASTCRFQSITPQGDEMASVDFTISGESNFTRRYVGSAG